MQLETSKFGRVHFTLEDVVVFPEGLLEAPQLRRWLLLGDARDQDLFWLQSLDQTDTAWAVVDTRIAGFNQLAGVPSRIWDEILDDCPEPVSLVRLLRTPRGPRTECQTPFLIDPQRRIGAQLQVLQHQLPPQLHPPHPARPEKVA